VGTWVYSENDVRRKMRQSVRALRTEAWIIFHGGKGSVPVLLPTANNNSFSSLASVLVRVTPV